MKRLFLLGLLGALGCFAQVVNEQITPVLILPNQAHTTAGQLWISNSAGTFHSGFTSAATSNLVWTLPTADSAGCLESNGSGLLSFASCSSSGSMVYPSAGLALSSGSAWLTSPSLGNAANNVLQLDSSGNLNLAGNIVANSTYTIGTSSNFWGPIFSTEFQGQEIQITDSTSFLHNYFIGEDSSNNFVITKGNIGGIILSMNAVGTVAFVTLYGGLNPSTDSTTGTGETLGGSGAHWADISTYNLHITGACTGCPGVLYTAGSGISLASNVISNTGILSATDGTVTSGVLTNMVSTDGVETITGLKTWGESIHFSNDNLYTFGTFANQLSTLWSHVTNSQKFDILDSTGLAGSWNIQATVNSGNIYMQFEDPSNTSMLTLSRELVSSTASVATLDGDFVPATNNTRGLGGPGGAWKSLYVGSGGVNVGGTDSWDSSGIYATNDIITATNLEFGPVGVGGGELKQGGAVRIDANGNAFFTSCTGCNSSTSQLWPLAAGIMVYAGSNAFGTSLTAGTANLVSLNTGGTLPALNASALTNFPTLNQNTTGNAATATALGATPLGCNATAYANGVDVHGNSISCSQGLASTSTPTFLGLVVGSGGLTMSGNISANTINPSVTNTYSLGSGSFEWLNILTQSATIGSGGLSMAGNIASLQINPATTNSYGLGTSSLVWSSAYINALHVTSCVGCGATVPGTANQVLISNGSGGFGTPITPSNSGTSGALAEFNSAGGITTNGISYLDSVSLPGGAIIAFNGSTSGTITLQTSQANAGTYNFNLPTSSGSLGQALISGGGGTNSTFWQIPTFGTSTAVSSAAAGSIEILGGASTNSSQGLQGLYLAGESYVKASSGTITRWNLECLTAANTVGDCPANPTQPFLGIAETVNSNTVVVISQGQIFVSAPSGVTVGHTVCSSNTTAGIVVDSTGLAPCPIGSGQTIGVAIANSGTYTLPDGVVVTATSTLPLVQLTQVYPANNIVSSNTPQTITGQKTFGATLLTTASTNDIGTISGWFGNVFGTQFTGSTLQLSKDTTYAHEYFLGLDSSNNLALTNGSYQIANWSTVLGAGQMTLFGSLTPNANNTQSIGTSSLYWGNGFFQNMTVTGTCSGCGSTYTAGAGISIAAGVISNTGLLVAPSDMATTDTAQTISGIKNFSNNITFNTDNCCSIGTQASQPQEVFAHTTHSSKFEIQDPSLPASFNITANVTTALDSLAINDNGNVPILSLYRRYANTPTYAAFLDASLLPCLGNQILITCTMTSAPNIGGIGQNWGALYVSSANVAGTIAGVDGTFSGSLQGNTLQLNAGAGGSKVTAMTLVGGFGNVSVVLPATFASYNLNLPVAGGTAVGQVLSWNGANSPMTWIASGGTSFSTLPTACAALTYANGISTVGNALNCSQGLGTTSSPTFANLTLTGAISSSVTGASIGFQTANSNFEVDGYGDISSGGSINALGNSTLALAPFRVNGQTVIDSNRAGVFSAVTAGTSQITNNILSTFLGDLNYGYGQFQLILYQGTNVSTSYGLGIESGNLDFLSDGGYKFYRAGSATPIMTVGSAANTNVSILGQLTVGSCVGCGSGGTPTSQGLAYWTGSAWSGSYTPTLVPVAASDYIPVLNSTTGKLDFSITGSAASLASTSQCASGSAPTGISTTGAAQNCQVITGGSGGGASLTANNQIFTGTNAFSAPLTLGSATTNALYFSTSTGGITLMGGDILMQNNSDIQLGVGCPGGCATTQIYQGQVTVLNSTGQTVFSAIGSSGYVVMTQLPTSNIWGGAGRNVCVASNGGLYTTTGGC